MYLGQVICVRAKRRDYIERERIEGIANGGKAKTQLDATFIHSTNHRSLIMPTSSSTARLASSHPRRSRSLQRAAKRAEKTAQ